MTDIDDLLADVAYDDLPAPVAVEWLRRHGYLPCAEAVEDAVAAIRRRDRFLAHDGDPYDYLGVDPRPGLDAWTAAAERADQEYAVACNVISRRPVRLAVTG
jgi:hypothetical protein